MSQKQKPLPPNELFGIVQPMERLSARVRSRLREEMKRKKTSQRDISGMLKWSQSRVAHLLTGRVEIGVDDMESLAFALSLSLVELVRDRGLEFCADMTPTELRLFEHVRALSPDQRTGLLRLLNVRQDDTRSALPPKAPPKTRRR